MQQINEIISNGAVSILIILLGIVVKAVKEYLVKKGGEQTVKIVEILAKNAVNAVEQVSAETGYKGEEKTSSTCISAPKMPVFTGTSLASSRLKS